VLLNSFEKDQLSCKDVYKGAVPARWCVFATVQQKTFIDKVEGRIVLLERVLEVFVA